ncbi:monocarboxylate transporter 10-like [Stylophora pistillata]|uniref:Monocarboxylate transporter 10 n=1 Tax=Stylophora pistillata TaxID=50429 RepID=A0A2B4RCZ8_STYPI|nr:monocarboxylate transporter 10-like [Stylophora pistillata]PFX14175.1 Monocarboxylate transporter 10 [Stylophora pistillata]
MERRPDGLWSCLVCAASILSILITTGGPYAFGLLLPPLMDEFNTTRQETAWVGSLNGAFGHFLNPLSVHVADLFGLRAAAILGSLSGIIGLCLASFSQKLWIMFPTYGFLTGFGFMTIFSVSVLAALQYFVKWRSIAAGLVASATSVSMFAMTQMIQALLSAFGWRGAMRGMAGLCFICGLSSAVYLPMNKAKENNELKMKTIETIKKKENESHVLKNRRFLVFCASITVTTLGFYNPIIHIIKHCQQELNIPEERSFMLYTYLAVASLISRFVFCKLGDFQCVSRFVLYRVSVVIYGICVLLLPFVETFNSLVVIFVVFGLMDGGAFGQFSLLVLNCVGQRKVNQGWGYAMFSVGFGMGLGPPLAGYMADEFGSYDLAFYISGVVLIAGAAITLLIKCIKQPARIEVIEEENTAQKFGLLVVEKVSVL